MSAVAHVRMMAELLYAASQGQAKCSIDSSNGRTDGAVYPLAVADGASNQLLSFPGVTTLTELLILPLDKNVTVTLGPTASNQGKTVNAGGMIGFVNGSLTASTGAYVTYTPGDASTANLLIYYGGN